jgi:hypothetical protein
MSLLYSLRIGNRVIIHSVSMVLGLGILVDTPCLAEFVVALEESDNPLMPIIHVSSGGKVGYMVPGLSTLSGVYFI